MALLISKNTISQIIYNFLFVANTARDRSLRQLLQGQRNPMQELPKAAIF
jgi:hypothetical protein